MVQNDHFHPKSRLYQLEIDSNVCLSKQVHWDHVKFEHPVYLDQIRIIPKDCVVSLKNGSSRFG